jgi:ABC-2 type transport system permease protein
MRSIYLVARREYVAYVSSWGFWLGLILTPVGLMLGGVLPSLILQSQPIRYYAVLDADGSFARALDAELERRLSDEARGLMAAAMLSQPAEAQQEARRRFDEARAEGLDVAAAYRAAGAPDGLAAPERKLIEVPPPARDLAALTPWLTGERSAPGPRGARPLFAALVVTRGADGRVEEVQYWSEDVVTPDLTSAANGALRELARDGVLRGAGVDPAELRRAEREIASVVERRPAGGDGADAVSVADRAPFFVATAVSFLLWLLVFSIVNFLIMGTIEERSNKIFDSLLTSVRLTHLLAGKLLGVFALCVTLLSVWGLLAGGLLLRASDPATLQIVAAALEPGLVFAAIAGFVGGYVMYAAIFLALGSLCDTIQEAQTLMSPLIVFLMAPLFVVVIAIRTPASPLIEALAWFPPFTPFLMILRAPLEPPLWQTVLQTGLTAGFAALALWASVRVYRAGAVHGAGVAQAWGWLGRAVGISRRTR